MPYSYARLTSGMTVLDTRRNSYSIMRIAVGTLGFLWNTLNTVWKPSYVYRCIVYIAICGDG